MKSLSILAALCGAPLLVSCGGGGPAPAPVPAPSAQAPVVIAAAPAPEPQAAPQPFVYGVDLDTVRAGPFDQGKMWTFDAPPVQYFADTYGLNLDEAWFERARLGALRIPSCSASLVSPNGLVLTNHHCAREFVSQVTRPGETLLDDGFTAQNLADEREVEEFTADQLIDIVDVTDEVNRALDALPAAQRGERRESLLEEIEARILSQRGGEGSGYMVEMVSLYNGGRTSAYVFRQYTNAKLVMAPELQIGFFGGDPDNFTYPRYNLDFSLFRLYGDDGRPLSTESYFPFDDDGLEEGDPIFIVGNPGSTSRLQTVAELEFRRDVSDRGVVDLLRTRMEALDAFIRAYPAEAEARDLRNTYFSLSNSLKAYTGQVTGLEDPIVIARRMDTERSFQAAIEADPNLRARYGTLIGDMADLQEQKREQAPGFSAFLAMTSPDLESATLHRALLAFQIVGARQNGAPAAAIQEVVDEMLAVPQQHPQLNRDLMAARFRDFVRFFGADSEIARSTLAGMSVEARAEAVFSGSVLADSARAAAAIRGNSLTMADPALAIVQAYLPAFIEFQQTAGGIFPEEAEIAADLGRARYEVYGTDVPPDATFSLRIADGLVTGYEYNGTIAPVFTTFYGIYDRHYSFPGKVDWALPEKWQGPPADSTSARR